MRLLIGEDFSPWTEKACWALAHHGVVCTSRQFQPLLDEPWLRLKTRNYAGKATGPRCGRPGAPPRSPAGTTRASAPSARGGRSSSLASRRTPWRSSTRCRPSSRRRGACWTEPRLAAKHHAVLAWRDELYARHRWSNA
ncbi:MAG: hypothetical protein Q8S73_15675 [Deltaproteobacteria bacterium]|nr:hypothetical protein [Myxococcales bacterium]MDP3215546.1 hypothetical protein [Deltaproteobacteria bacterium]